LYSIPAAALADLEANPDVAYVSVDRPLSSTASGSAPAPVVDHHSEAIQAAAAWAQGLDGTGIGVAIIDSGIARVNDLNARAVVYTKDFVGDGAMGADLYGHGTHAAGNNGRDNSAGTDGYGTVTSPGNDPYVITVGATNTLATADRTDDVPASYSSKGPTLLDQVIKPDLVAPGNMVVSLYAVGENL